METTKQGRGRPAIGDKVTTRLTPEVKAKFDAYAAERGLKEAEAARHLIMMALDGVAAAAGPMTLDRLLPDLTEDEFWERLDAGDFDTGDYRRSSFGNAETRDDPNPSGYDITLSVGAKLVRGWWLIYCHTYPLTIWANGHRGADVENVDRSYTLAQGKDEAVNAYKQMIQDLTSEHFDPAKGPMWSEGFQDDTIGYDIEGETQIPWRSLIPAESVVDGIQDDDEDDGEFHP